MIDWTIILLGWLGLVFSFALGWRWGVKHRNAGIVDVLWAFTLAGLVGWYALAGSGEGGRRLLIGLCTGLWGLRLGWHILRRLRGDGEEDPRYAFLRSHWGDSADRNFFFFFQAQGLANVLLALPIHVLMANPAPFSWWDAVGALVIAGAVFGERLADEQLVAWKRNPENKGKTCRKGLWAWSRHPNYFFEWVHWLGYPVMGVALVNAGYGAWWWLTLLGPVVMLALLLRATGIPYTEKQALKSRGDNYRRYQAEVSPFIPWPPRKRASAQSGEESASPN
jgi:steroid 5-alpha reductase family enzyme